MEESLKVIWDDNSLRLFELASLRYKDIELAANKEKLSFEDFINQIIYLNIVPLAIKPITLDFLIQQFRQNGKLPSTQQQLYEAGCILLADEIDNQRRQERNKKFDASKRLQVASRLAALCIFGRKSLISIESQDSLKRQDVLPFREAIGSTETSKGNSFEVRESEIQDTLSTALFSAGPKNLLEWSHQAYPEYLAARYLVERKLTDTQILDIFTDRTLSGERVVPELRESAAWVATFKNTIFKQLLKLDPEVLLRSEVLNAGDESRESLVENLLYMYESESTMHDAVSSSIQSFKQLNHKNITGQLETYIKDSRKNVNSRLLAIDIAEATCINFLQKNLVLIALDEEESLFLRSSALRALKNADLNSDNQSKLKVLATSTLDSDIRDDIKGLALTLTWPSSLSIDEVLGSLTKYKQLTFIGSYKLFIMSDFLSNFNTIDECTKTLKWLTVNQNWAWIRRDVCGLLGRDGTAPLDSLLCKSLEDISNTELIEALSTFMYQRAHENDYDFVQDIHSYEFRNHLQQDHNLFRIILDYIVSNLINDTKTIRYLIMFYRELRLISHSDLDWLLQQLSVHENEDTKLYWAVIIKDIVQLDKQFTQFYGVYRDQPILQKVFKDKLGSIVINSPEAIELKKEYKESLEYSERFEKTQNDRDRREKENAEYFETCLIEVETNSEKWWEVAYFILSDSTPRINLNNHDLTETNIWVTFDAEVKGKLLDAAYNYLIDYEPLPEEWLHKRDQAHFPAWAGFQAFWLLLKERKNLLNKVSSVNWQKWACIISTYPALNYTNNGEQELDTSLQTMCYDHASKEYIDAVILCADIDLTEKECINGTNRIFNIWNEKFEYAFLELLSKHSNNSKAYKALVDLLLENSSQKTVELVRTKLQQLDSINDKEQCLLIAETLIRFTTDASWDIIWPIVKVDSEFGNELLLKTAGKFYNIESRLEELDLARLYTYLEKEFPPEEDPDRSNEPMAYQVTPRDEVVFLRSSILTALQNAGSEHAIQALENISEELEYPEWIKFTIAKARKNFQNQNWQPLSPESILKITRKPNTILITNPKQLLSVILASLERLQQKFISENPLNMLLWDMDNRKKASKGEPKDEADLADLIKSHLTDDLKNSSFILNREVEIRQRQGESQGERVDILIDCIVPDSNEKVGLIIEVKGCWNKDVLTAMKNQLSDRYLMDNPNRCGIYLVGWFLCERWNKKDYRCGITKKLKMDLNEMRSHLADEAKNISENPSSLSSFVLDISLR